MADAIIQGMGIMYGPLFYMQQPLRDGGANKSRPTMILKRVMSIGSMPIGA
ncbi:hypothetical protein [Maritalea mediterranea]|uniref:Uncharacterized protein n=1 Tax=Maritalea mediterranea TaxID=2909667 RepID=A0ABS9EA75_9HYPH|nr:hypothetical protein [Maritalea mediterranea]MCF4099099.1 hypothetical protein [Maritalea mediterranea]